jgi:hypothetical protein
MQVKISKELKRLYETTQKGLNHSLRFIVESMDLDCCATAAMLVRQFALSGEKSEVTISDELVQELTEKLKSIEMNDMRLEAFLWVAVLFPEV